MQRIISYDEIPKSDGHSIYLRMETDPKLYLTLLSKGYRIVNKVINADESTIFVTGRRQDNDVSSVEEYRIKCDKKMHNLLGEKGVFKPITKKFSYDDLLNHKYNLPFVLKNENQNGGREKFLIATEEDYDNLIKAISFLLSSSVIGYSPFDDDDLRSRIDYQKYFETGIIIQEYIKTPSTYNTSLRVLTSASNDLLCAFLKYNLPEKQKDETTMLGYLLKEVYPLSTKTIVSNTLAGGNNILIGNDCYTASERDILNSHHVDQEKFQEILELSQDVHIQLQKELGIICAFDYIYDKEREQWFFLEHHSRPMVGEYSKLQGLSYISNEDRIVADGRVRATALKLVLTKNK